MFTTLLCFLLVLSPAFAGESAKLPEGWKREERVAQTEFINLIVAVKQQNLDVLEETLLRVSDPRHSDYGNYLSRNEVDALVAPRAEHVSAVIEYLVQCGVEVGAIKGTSNSDFLTASVPVKVAETVLGGRFHYYAHKDFPQRVARLASLSYSLPARVDRLVDFVGPSVRFPSTAFRAFPVSSPDAVVTPAYLKNLYQVGTAHNLASNNVQAVGQFLEQYYTPSDLALFLKTYVPTAGDEQPTVIGPNVPDNPGIEASLDIQYIMGMGLHVPTQFWYTAGRQPGNDQNEPFLVWLMNLANTTDFPRTFSVSYGDNENTVEYDYAVRVNAEFQKAGVRGVTLLFSSGDGGVSGSQPTVCHRFIPTFPAASPWVTSVGGTTNIPEVAASFSTGGFSDRWGRTSWQAAAVEKYFTVAQDLPEQERWNRSGRGFPDVSAQSYNFQVVVGGQVTGVAGTSCSTPTFAGMVAILNSMRLAANKAPLGFLAPLLYQHPTVLNDITSGNNPGCGTDGFHAAPGWDPITGLGTPNFARLTQLVSSLP